MPTIPQAKLPHIPLPAIRSLPTIPFVGCGPGDGNSYAGRQFGNVPDLGALVAMRGLKKSLEEQIYVLLKGQLPFATRPAPYAAREAQLINEVAELVDAIASIIDEVTSNVNDSIAFINEQIGAANQLKSAIVAVPEMSRSAVQKLMIDRYTRYVQEMNAQTARLQSTVNCLAA